MATFTTYENRLAVVTGAASGIGRELLFELVRRGAHVAACDVDRGKLEAAARQARAHESDAIHLLFNNAGVVGGGSFVVGNRSEWERTFAVSWFGTYPCTRAFLAMLVAADQGVVVNTSSVNALWASLGKGMPHTAYSAAKSAVRGFTESLIVDFQAHAPHLSAVLVLPGHVRSGMPAPPRSWRRALGAEFAGCEPVSSAQAARTILDAVSSGDWRIVIGQDAETVDARVRADPWSVYD